jgi:SAM-dependent methyltransferase
MGSAISRSLPNNPTLVVSAIDGRKPGKALDFGMGQGRNAVFLALQGWDVTGFDLADEAVRIANGNAAAVLSSFFVWLRSSFWYFRVPRRIIYGFWTGFRNQWTCWWETIRSSQPPMPAARK